MSEYNFASSLKKGKAGEALLCTMWPELVPLAGKGADFVTPTDEALELKSDSYDMNDTPNFFIERWSDVHTRRPGGPFQAWSRGCTLFAYMFVPNKTVYVFRTADIMKAIEDMEASGQVNSKEIKNTRWSTVGYRVPREALEHLVLFMIKGKE